MRVKATNVYTEGKKEIHLEEENEYPAEGVHWVWQELLAVFEDPIYG
jgi:hypothetical protein